MSSHRLPPGSPDRKRTPGYPEPQPRDREDAARDGARTPNDPDEGGLDRDPEADGKPGPA